MTELTEAQTRGEESVRSKLKEFKTGGWGAHYALIICCLLYLICSVDRYMFSAVLQPMKVELALTDSELGLAQTLFMLGLGLFSFPIAHLIDRWSRKRSIAIMAVLWSVTTAMTGLAKNFIGIVIPRSFVGIGEAGFTSGGIALISASYKKEWRSRILSIFVAVGMAGAAVGLMLGGAISAKFGWHTAFFVLGAPGIILGILALFMRDYKTVDKLEVIGERKGFGKSILTLLKIPTLLWCYIGGALVTFLTAAVGSWLPAYAMRTMNINEAAAGMMTGYMMLAVIPGAPLGGFLADLWQKKSAKGRILLMSLAGLVSTICIIIIVIVTFNAFGIAMGVLYGFTGIMTTVIVATVSQDVVPPEHKGLAYGVAVFISYATASWAPLAVGAVSDALGGGVGGLRTALIGSGVIAIIGSMITLLAARHYGPDKEKVMHLTLQADK